MRMSRILSPRSVQNVQIGVGLYRKRRTMFQMLRDAVLGRYKMSILTLMVLVLGVIYILFPFDFIPDFVPFLGWIDDGAIIYLLLKRLTGETSRYNRHKAMSRKAS